MLLLIASSVRLLLAPRGRSHSGCRQLLLAIPPGRSVPESAAPRTDRTRSRWRRFPDRGHVLGRLRVRVVDVHLENLPCIPPILHGRISSTCHFVTMKCLGDHRTALPLAADVNLLSLAVF
ncbi:hypothetical protein V8E55_009247 [Tylopilus felleus]